MVNLVTANVTFDDAAWLANRSPADKDGSYTVTWIASPTVGVIYTMQEAINSSFTTDCKVGL